MPSFARASVLGALAALLLVAPPRASIAYDVCRSPGSGAVATVTGAMETSGFEWDCTPVSETNEVGAPDCGDDFYVLGSDRVVLTGTVCSEAEPASGVWQVAGRLDLDPSAPVTLHRSGFTNFNAGSDGIWRGFELPPDAVPLGVRTERWNGTALVDSTAHLALRYAGGLPWPACADPGCAEASAGDRLGPGSHLYFDFETLPGTPRGGRAPALEVPFYEPGAFLEVASVVDTAGDKSLDTVVLRLPTTGPGFGAQHFGADGQAVPIPGGAAEGRCEECLQETATQTHRGAVSGATKVDTSGFHLRNAIGEAAWTVESAARVVCDAERSGTDCLEGEERFEIRVRDAAFDSDREFEGFLACLPEDQQDFALGSERWCGRIVGSVDAQDADGDGDVEDVLTVLHDPRGWLEAGERLNVYYFRPVPGQKIVPFNLHTVAGQDAHHVQAVSGSHFGRTTGACEERPCLGAIHWRRPGPESGARQPYALWLHNPDQLAVDAMLFEHGGPVDGERSGTKYLVLGQSGTSIDGVSRVDLSRIHCRFPSGRTDESDKTSGTVYGHGCLRLVTGDPAGSGAETDVWRGFSARKIRCEGTAQCFLWQGSHYGCQAGQPALQDLYAAHTRDWVDDRVQWNLEQIEFQGQFEASCPAAMDRYYVAGHTSGSPIILRAIGRDSDPGDYHTEITSGVVLGCNDGASPCIVGNKLQAEGVHLTDLLVDGGHKIPAGASYGAQTGFEPAPGFDALPGVHACQPLRGFVARGLPERLLNRNTGNCGAETDTLLADSALFGYAADGGHHLYDASVGPPPGRIEFRRSVFACASGAARCRLFETSDETPADRIERFTLEDALFLRSSPGAEGHRVLRLQSELFAPASIGIGPNVHGNAALSCESFPGDALFADAARCQPADALARTGEGSDSAVNDESLAGAPAAPSAMPLAELGALRLAEGAELAPACEGEGGPCRVEDALPRWAGPIGRAWPFAVATVSPLPVFERGGPAEGSLPAILRDRVPACMNGIDDDGDGAVDAAEDAGCRDVEWSTEAPACADGVDNDGDGAVDWDGAGTAEPDRQCRGDAWRLAEDAPSRSGRCGLGLEIVAALLPILWLRRRRAP